MRYLEVFDSVRVLARVREAPAVPPGWKRLEEPGVEVFPIPFFRGPFEFLLRLGQIKSQLRKAIGPGDALILQMPAPLGPLIRSLIPSGRPFGVEALGDPLDLFSRGTYDTKFLFAIRILSYFQMQTLCRKACAASYVTKRALQARYPCPGFSVGVSDVLLGNDCFRSRARVYGKEGVRRLLLVGSLEHRQKGPDILLEAFSRLPPQHRFSLTLVGDGCQRPFLEAMALRAGRKDRIKFVGQVPSNREVLAFFQDADLFVLPSRAEGLPRAMIEAMAQGLPCLGSRVGGIPELLAEEDLIPVADSAALAAKILEVAHDPERLQAMSERNLAMSRAFQGSRLEIDRRRFLTYLRDASVVWTCRANRNRSG